MPGPRDILSAATLYHRDVASLNFIRDNPAVGFRNHFREGLRSRIVEVLNSRDLEKENRGVVVDGVRLFPRASPLYILRLFRRPFATIEEAAKEAQSFSTLKKYLGAAHLATSTEFIVSYRRAGGQSIMLCGLQQYVKGEIFNPWAPIGAQYLVALHRSMGRHQAGANPWSETEFVNRARSSFADLTDRVKTMIVNEARIPDLTGIGNLVLTVEGAVKLVDINNVAPVVFDASVYLDDQGYPVCDKSVEVLALMEEKLLDRPPAAKDPLYTHFLRDNRRRRVDRKVREFQNA